MLKIKDPQLRVLDGRYSLLRVIGQGSAGVVYQGTQLAVDRTVAVKLLHLGRGQDDVSMARFNLEAKALGQLNHPGCVTLFDFGHDAGLDAYFMVMEFIHGSPLSQVREEGISLRDELGVMAAVCRAVGHAHKKGITHRDLKPSNIMLPQGSSGAKVLDFGLAKLFAETLQPKRISVTGEIYGTPAYMSPEQALGEADVGPAADIYALGIMLYEAIEKSHPFPGKTPAIMLMMHLETPMPTPQSPHVSKALHDLIVAMTQKDPQARPVDLEHIAQLLEAEMALLPTQKLVPPIQRTIPQFGPNPTQETWDGFQDIARSLDSSHAPMLVAPKPEAVGSLQDSQVPSGRGRGRMLGLVLVLIVGVLAGGSFAWHLTPELDPASYTPRTLHPVSHIQPTALVPVTYLRKSPPPAPRTIPKHDGPQKAQPALRKPPARKKPLVPRVKTLSL